MLIKPAEHLKKTDPLKKPYKGIVVDVNDPKRLGRVKAYIQGLIESTDPASLPWIYPWNPVSFGGRGDSSSFIPLNLGAELVIEFPFEDVYAPFYTGFWQSQSTHQGSFNEDYPYSYGFQDEKGNMFRVNKAKQIAEFVHSSGGRVQFQKDSTFEVRSRKGVRFISEDGHTEIFFDLETGDMSLAAKNQFALSGNKASITPKEVEISTGQVKENISGAKESQVVGGKKTTIGGSESLSVVSNRAVSIGGDYSKLVAGKTEQTWGQGAKQTSVLGDVVTKLIAGDRNVNILLGNYKVSLLAGNYDVDVVAGNITIKTSAGSIELGNLLGKLEIGIAGDIKFSNPLASIELDVTGNVTIKATLNLDLEATLNTNVKGIQTTITGTAQAQITGALTVLGNSVGPVVTQVTSPFIDLITGAPQMGVPTVLAG